jgi:hypothetical protein
MRAWRCRRFTIRAATFVCNVRQCVLTGAFNERQELGAMNNGSNDKREDDDLNHVLHLESNRQAAMLAADTAVLKGLLAEDVVYVHSSGVVEGRTPYLETIASGKVIYKDIQLKIDDVRRLCIDAILLVGTTRMQTVQFGTAKALHNIFMMVWARGKDGVWRMASWQSTVVPG